MIRRRRRYVDPDLQDLWRAIVVLSYLIAIQGLAIVIVVLAVW